MRLNRRSMVAAIATLPAAARAAEWNRGPGIDRLSPALDRIVDASAAVEVLGTGYRWAEGPVWIEDGGYLLFDDVPANTMYRWQPGGGAPQVFLRPSGLEGPVPADIREAGANGLALDARGRLLIADSGTRVVARMDLATRRRTLLAARYGGKRFNSPNDLVEGPDGAIWFTDPPYGLTDGDTSPLRELPFNGVYRIAPGGAVTLVDGTLSKPNGIGLSPDGRTLYVAISDPARPQILAYPLTDRGTPAGVRVFADFTADHATGAPGMPDGLTVAPDGTLFASGPGGIHLLSPAGERLGLIRTGKAIANCAIGEGGRSLFLTASDSLARVRLRGN